MAALALRADCLAAFLAVAAVDRADGDSPVGRRFAGNAIINLTLGEGLVAHQRVGEGKRPSRPDDHHVAARLLDAALDEIAENNDQVVPVTTVADPDSGRPSTEDGEPAFRVQADHTFEGAPAEVEYPFANDSSLVPGEQFYVLLSADHPEPIIALDGEMWFSSLAVSPPQSKGSEVPFDTHIPTSGSVSCVATVSAPSKRGSVMDLFNLFF